MSPTSLAHLAFLALITAATASPHLAPRQSGTVGCGNSHDSGYKTNSSDGFVIVSGGRTRRYNVRIPDNYNTDHPYALILDFHGHGKTRDDQYQLTHYDQFATGRKDFIVVYPQGLKDADKKPAWEGAPYAWRDVSDLKFVDDLLDKFRRNYCIDNNRIYASGKSNGGGFVGTLACSPQGGQFAAFAAAAAALYTDNLNSSTTTFRTCTPSRAKIPILEAHGTEDGPIRYHGKHSDRNRTTPSIPDWLATWAGRDGCSGGRVTQEFDGYGTQVWSCPGYPGVVTGYRVDGFGHCWPGGVPEEDNENCGNSPFDFTPKVLAFFNSWDLNGFMGVTA